MPAYGYAGFKERTNLNLKRIISLVLIFILALGVLPICAAADAATGTVLYEKNSKTQAYPASTTKIMTCILAIENAADINEIVNTGSNVETRGSTCHFSRNEEMPLIDMLYGMMMFSGNDAAKAIAEHIGGSESGFAEMMNKKAAGLGMTIRRTIIPPPMTWPCLPATPCATKRSAR